MNGVPVTTQYLRSLGEHLVEIHGQNEHQRLNSRTNQLAMLDDFAGLQNKVSVVRAAWLDWQEAKEKIAALEAALNSATDRKELLTYQLDELTSLSLQAGEFAKLEEDHKRLTN